MSERAVSYSKVKKLLEKYEVLRDNKCNTLATYWKNEIGFDKLKEMSAMELLHLIADGKVTNSETVLRNFRMVQFNNKDLRGAKFNERHNIDAPKTKEEIKIISQTEGREYPPEPRENINM